MTRAQSAIALVALTLSILVLAQAPPASPPGASEVLEAGWKAYESADYAKAIQLALPLQNESPAGLSAAELVGKAYLASGEPSHAVSAFTSLSSRRGTVQDYRFLSLACALAGRAHEASDALAKAEAVGTDATPESLYALGWMKPDADGRLALLKRSARDFAQSSSKLAPEIAFWEQRAGRTLRASVKPLPGDGLQVKLKTLYDMEWAVCTAASGEEVWLMVDTACRQTVLSKDTATRLKLPVVQASYPVAGAYPQEPAPAYTVLDSLDLGGYRIQNVPALVVDDKAQLLSYREGRNVLKGILGMDLLRGLKVRFDRQKNLLTLLPPEAALEKLLDGKPSEWRDFPAFSAYDQVLVFSMVGAKNPVLGLLDTGCLYVTAGEAVVPGSGLTVSSRNSINLNFHNFAVMDNPMGERAAGKAPTRAEVLGWLEECLPPAGSVQTVPQASMIGFAGMRFALRDLPIYPRSLGSDIPIGVVVGRKITDFFAIALDLGAGKVYVKQVLFK